VVARRRVCGRRSRHVVSSCQDRCDDARPFPRSAGVVMCSWTVPTPRGGIGLALARRQGVPWRLHGKTLLPRRHDHDTAADGSLKFRGLELDPVPDAHVANPPCGHPGPEGARPDAQPLCRLP